MQVPMTGRPIPHRAARLCRRHDSCTFGRGKRKWPEVRCRQWSRPRQKRTPAGRCIAAAGRLLQMDQFRDEQQFLPKGNSIKATVGKLKHKLRASLLQGLLMPDPWPHLARGFKNVNCDVEPFGAVHLQVELHCDKVLIIHVLQKTQQLIDTLHTT